MGVQGLADGFLAGFNTADAAISRKKELGLRDAMLQQQVKDSDRNYGLAQAGFDWKKDTDNRDFDNLKQQQALSQQNADRNFSLDARRVNISAAGEARQSSQQQMDIMEKRFGGSVSGIMNAVRAGDSETANALWSRLPKEAQQFYNIANPGYIMNPKAAQGSAYLASMGSALMSGQVNPDDPKVISAANEVLAPELSVKPGELADDGKPMKARRLTHIMPAGQAGNYHFGVEITRADGSIYSAPITKNRSTDPKDEVLSLSSEKVMQTLAQRAAAFRMLNPAGAQGGETYTPPDENQPFMPVQDFMQVPQHIRFQQINAGKTADEIMSAYNNSGMERQKYINDLKKNGQLENPDPNAELKGATQGQLKTAGFAYRLQNSLNMMDQLATDGASPRTVGTAFGAVGGGAVSSMLLGNKNQQWQSAARDAIAAVLRHESGAAIPDSEVKTYMQMYFPQAGDTDETSQAKRGLLQAQLNQLIAQSGGAYDAMSQSIAQRQDVAGVGKAPSAAGELRLFGDKPFSTERMARASRSGKTPGAKIEAVEDGFAIRMPPAGEEIQSTPSDIQPSAAPQSALQPDVPQNKPLQARQLMGSAGVPIVPEAVQMLRNNPASAAQFDQTFGEGMSEYFLGGQPGPKAEGLTVTDQPAQTPSPQQYAQSAKVGTGIGGAPQSAPGLPTQSTQISMPASANRAYVMDQARQSGWHPELGAAHEFTSVDQESWDAMRTNIRRLPPADQMRVAGMITAKFGGSARQDEQGRIYVTVPSGEYLLNAPGMTRQAVDNLSQVQPAPAPQSDNSIVAPVSPADPNPYAQFAPRGIAGQAEEQDSETESNPYARFATQQADPQQQGVMGDIALGMSEAGKSIAQAGVNTANIIPEVGDAVQSAAAWTGKQMGIGDGTYTPATRFELPENLRPQTNEGQIAAEALPYLVNPASSLARNATGAGAKIAGLAAENATGVLAANSNQHDAGKLAQDMGTSMAVSGATRVAANAIGTGYRALKGQIAPESKAAIDFADQHNAPLMTSDIKQPQTFVGRSAQQLGEKIPLVGTGQMRANQQQARSRLVDDFSQRYGTYSADDVVNSLKSKTDAVKKAAGARFNEIRTRMDSVGNIEPQKAISAIDSEISHLSRLGKVSDTDTIARLKDYREELSNGKITFSLLDDLRTQFRTDVKGERMVMPDRSTVALNRVYDGMTNDLNAAVRKGLGSRDVGRWANAKAVYAEEAQKVKNTRIKNILLKGHLTPESVNTMLFSNKPSDVKILYESLDTKGRQSARAGLIAKAMDGEASPDRFLMRLNKLSAQTRILFKGEERQYLTGLKKYLESTRRASQSSLTLPNGQVVAQGAAVIGPGLVGIFAGPVAAAKTVTAGLAYAGMARAYESTAVRNAMLKLANKPRGSSAFERDADAVNRVLTATLQGMKE
ncbi:hypothetical protein [Serratia plymuthica]|uniref:hypothetical protein n=1 Tax=Serratia plymuthica TaxID=82996 RepID=UPI0020C8BD31|nr:hypothetical protein [Serratia plymuthica]UTN95866.1 hypothetical protein NLX81_20770 [Serratia plymuthica]